MVELFYTTYISVDLAHQVIFHAKVGNGCIKEVTLAIIVIINLGKYKKINK